MLFFKRFEENIEEVILVILLVVITTVMFVQVIMRYALGNSLVWAEELCRYCFTSSIFIGAGYCVKKDAMFRMTFIVEKLPKRLHYALELISDVLLIVFFLFWTFNGRICIENGIRNNLLSTAMRIPYYVIYIMMVIGLAGGAIRSLQKLIGDIRGGIRIVEEEKNEAIEVLEALEKENVQ